MLTALGRNAAASLRALAARPSVGCASHECAASAAVRGCGRCTAPAGSAGGLFVCFVRGTFAFVCLRTDGSQSVERKEERVLELALRLLQVDEGRPQHLRAITAAIMRRASRPVLGRRRYGHSPVLVQMWQG